MPRTTCSRDLALCVYVCVCVFVCVWPHVPIVTIIMFHIKCLSWLDIDA